MSGKYDRLKVYHNGSWVTPYSCKVYHAGSWWSLGNYDSEASYNSKQLYVEYRNTCAKVTKTRNDYYTYEDPRIEGRFNLLPAGQYNYCTKVTGNSSVRNQKFYFEAYIERTQAVEQEIFFNGRSNQFVRIKWLQDGRIQMQAKWADRVTVYHAESENAVQEPYRSVHLIISFDAGNRTGTCNFNGYTTPNFKVDTAEAYIANSTTTVGDTYMRFRSTFHVIGGANDNNTSTTDTLTLNASTMNGTDGYRYSNVNGNKTTPIPHTEWY
mgnify:CR=1 FL=1